MTTPHDPQPGRAHGGPDGLAARVRQYESSLPFVKVRYYDKDFLFAVPNEKCLYFATSLVQREPATSRWINTFKPADVFFDIGANNGIYALLAAMHRGCQAVAFEPHFASYYVLLHNIYANRLQDKVLAYPLALSDAPAYDVLYLSAITAGKSLNNYGAALPSHDPIRNAVIPQPAISDTLDRFVAASGLHPTHIKIDVDGIEPAILDGASRVLQNPALKSVMVELDMADSAHRAASQKMHEHGFVHTFADSAGVFFSRKPLPL